MRSQLQKLIRGLGALSDDKTPCGKDLPVSDAHALQLLREHGPLPQATLEALLGINKSSVSRLRSRLESSGRIEAVALRNEGRPITVLKMTAAGRNLANQLDEASGARFATLLRHIPGEKRKQVLNALDELNGALAQIAPDGDDASTALKKARSLSHDERGLLSGREWQVMRLVAQGFTSTEIGERLSIGRRTVETYRAHLYKKLGFRSQAALIRYAMERGIVPSLPKRRSRR